MSCKETLLQPIKIGNRIAQNRFFIQPMECNKEDETGNPSSSTLQRYCDLAKGGAGMVSPKQSLSPEKAAQEIIS